MGWLLINICLPVAAPLGMYLVFLCIPLPRQPRKRLNPILAVKDGQLCWAAIGFCASGLHEASQSAELDWLIGTLVFTLILSSLLACGGALFQTKVQKVPFSAWFEHYRCLVGSLLVTAFAGGLFALAHFNN